MLDVASRRYSIEMIYSSIFSRGNLEIANQFFSPSLVIEKFSGAPKSGILALQELILLWRSAFPDMEEVLLCAAITEDVTMAHFRFRGTHTGKLGELPATNRRVEMEGVDIFRFDGDRIVTWNYVEDRFALAAGLGLLLPTSFKNAWPFADQATE